MLNEFCNTNVHLNGRFATNTADNCFIYNMGNVGKLSSAFNMSWGFLPVVVTLFLYMFVSQDSAIYIGAVFGIIYSVWTCSKLYTGIPNYILYVCTLVLILFGVIVMASGRSIFPSSFPFLLEISLLIAFILVYLFRRKLVDYQIHRKEEGRLHPFVQSIEATKVTIRIFFLLGILHLLALSVARLFVYNRNAEPSKVLFVYLPLVLFAVLIIFNQIGLFYFNRWLGHTDYLPKVNYQGDVIGMSEASQALSKHNAFMNPVLRIAVFSRNWLFLCNRTSESIERGKVDLPLEYYLRYGESLEEGIRKLLNKLPIDKGLRPTFVSISHENDEISNRLVYLFTVEMPSNLSNTLNHLIGGKYWCLHQIDENLGKGYFSCFFEKEIGKLKEIIDTKETYKES